MSKAFRYAAAALLGITFAATTPTQADETFTTLKQDIFVCISPKVYDEAMVKLRELNGKDIESLKKDLAEKKQCMFVDAQMVDDLMAPYAVVLERDSGKVRVQFILQDRKKIEFLHRLINRIVLIGWTDEANLEPRKVL
jgi:hypothetical protein